MSPEEIESLLASLPVRAFAPETESRLLAAVLAARPPTRRWWQRPVPVWQAVAAALLFAAAAGLAIHGWAGARHPADMTRTQMAGSTHASEEPVVTAAAAISPYALDIRRWQVLAATTQGAPR